MSTTPVVAVDPDAPSPTTIERAAEVLRRGGLVAFATETVYGLGADATDEDAVRRIFVAKGRPSTNPLIVHVADLEMARQYAGRWSDAAERLARAAWPGPLTIVVPKVPSIPALVTAGLPTVGLRVPAPAVARALIRATGRPVAAPSANRAEHVSPTRAEHVIADLDGRLDLVLDSGPTIMGIESTVVDLVSDPPRVLRPGPLSAARLTELLAVTVGGPASSPAEGPAHSPGQHARHYAPRTPAVRVESLEALVALGLGPDDAVLAFGSVPVPADRPASWTVLRDPETAARELYALLRDHDARAPSRILVLMPPDEPEWLAVRDRLRRATTEPPA